MKRTDPEHQLQVAVVNFLRAMLPADAIITSFPAGGGGRTRGGLLKEAGLEPGMPDLLLLWRGETYCIELKTQTGRLSPQQKVMHDRLKVAGIPVVVCRSLNEVQGALQGWLVPMRGKLAA